MNWIVIELQPGYTPCPHVYMGYRRSNQPFLTWWLMVVHNKVGKLTLNPMFVNLP